MKISIIKIFITCYFLLVTFSFATCKYSARDSSPIPAEVKTFRVNPLDNKARYINPQLKGALTEKLKQKIIGQTRLRQINGDEAHYDISGYISDYSVITTGISNQNASTNRLNVTFHLIFKNTLNQKQDIDTDIINNYDFDARLSLPEAEVKLGHASITTIVDQILYKIFSNW